MIRIATPALVVGRNSAQSQRNASFLKIQEGNRLPVMVSACLPSFERGPIAAINGSAIGAVSSARRETANRHRRRKTAAYQAGKAQSPLILRDARSSKFSA